MSKPKPTRRDFIRTAAASAAGLALADVASGALRPPLALGSAKSCIFINMVGGPAHLDTFDPKPDAPSDVRGPFKAIQTKVPGVHLSELFPRLAKLTDKFSLIRSMHHDAPPVHECGFQLLNTGRLFRDGPEWPSVGAVVDHLFRESRSEHSSWVVLPNTNINTGISVGHGQSVGWLKPRNVTPETLPPSCYSLAPSFGDWCVLPFFPGEPARFLTINQFSTVFDSPSWDCH